MGGHWCVPDSSPMVGLRREAMSVVGFEDLLNLHCAKLLEECVIMQLDHPRQDD
jgi:hypothetical protein